MLPHSHILSHTKNGERAHILYKEKRGESLADFIMCAMAYHVCIFIHGLDIRIIAYACRHRAFNHVGDRVALLTVTALDAA